MEKKQEFEALAKEALPHLYALCEIAKEHGVGNALMNIVVSGDGHIDLRSTRTHGDWSLVKLTDEEPKIWHGSTPIGKLED